MLASQISFGLGTLFPRSSTFYYSLLVIVLTVVTVVTVLTVVTVVTEVAVMTKFRVMRVVIVEKVM